MNRKERLRCARNYCVFYGSSRVEQLSQYELVILEPLGHSAEEIKQLKDSGTLVVAYLSVMEVPRESEQCNLLDEDDFLKANNQFLMNSAYDTYLVDIRSKKWNAILEQTISQLINNSGYDGIFLDTIGDAEWDEIPIESRYSILWAAVNFVQRTRARFDENILIQNNGLGILCEYTSPYIDGICWENPKFTGREDCRWSKAVVKRLQGLRKRYKLKILFLVEGKCDFSFKIAKKNGFLLYNAPFQYTDLIYK